MEKRWVALIVVFFSSIQFPLNWFNIVPMFPHLAGEIGLTPVHVGSVVSAFVVGYGVMHIPGGMIAERYGMRSALLIGIAVEGLGAILTASAYNYQLLLFARLLCGVGGSIYLGSAIGIVTAWFRDKELATATGLVSGVAFSIGASIGLYGWGQLADVLGWRTAVFGGMVVSGASILLLVLAYPHPPLDDIGVTSHGHSLASLRRTLTSGRLWVMGFAFFGGYGSYLTAASMLPGYAVMALHQSPERGQEIGATLLFSGIVGSFLGGWLTDQALGLMRTFLLACLLEALALLLMPWLGPIGVEVAGGIIGIAFFVAFVSWIALPGEMSATFRTSDVPTAAGLLLSIGAIGGVVLPPVYAEFAARFGTSAAWTGLGGVTIASAFVAMLAGRNQVVIATR
ncbi:transporter [Burkholderia lata]|uniref:Transporter n=1 Tax=Burkholderia lata (strain ATCC 17760 / DSM 23089 / LMG 22485 / NCIMB 9086 / R18194 / 383) TaxID=482957 RepID=A0A6P2V2G1_BURL3|nr:MFS transporter [Burkholderia lata]VWC77346.1 transporter [Burkholderia lata]